MKIASPRALHEMAPEERTTMAAQANWVVRYRTQPTDRGVSSFVQLSKIEGWSLNIAESSPNFLSENARAITEGLCKCDATSLVGMSLPFYISDGTIIGYKGQLCGEAFAELAQRWAPFDYLVLAVANTTELPLAAIYVSFDDYALLLGPNSIQEALCELWTDDEPFDGSFQVSDGRTVGAEELQLLYDRLDTGCSLELET